MLCPLPRALADGGEAALGDLKEVRWVGSLGMGLVSTVERIGESDLGLARSGDVDLRRVRTGDLRSRDLDRSRPLGETDRGCER